MKSGLRWKYVAGAAALAAVAAAILIVFSLMSVPGEEDLLLSDSADERFGWSYELLQGGQVRPYELEFDENGNLPVLPEDIQAVRITRTMTERIPQAELEWMSYLDGVEVFLDGELLYSDFRRQPQRGEDGFLRLNSEDWDALHRDQGGVWKRVRMTLPEDYPGRELSVVTYFPEEWGRPVPEYPFLGSEDSLIASYVVFSVKNNVTTTIYALLALLIAGMFLIDISNDGADGRTLLLSLYFLLLFLEQANASYAGYYGKLNSYVEAGILNELYVVPLYLYLLMRLRGRWKYPLGGAIVAWALYEGVREFLESRSRGVGVAESMGPGTLVVFLVVMIACIVDALGRDRRAQWNRREGALYALTAAAITIAYVAQKVHAWGSLRAYLVNGIWVALSVGTFEPIVSLVTDITSIMALIVVLLKFVQRTLRTHREMSALEERGRQTMEGYNRLLAAREATSALRHEMSHHLNALSGILNSGDLARASKYVSAVSGELEQIPADRYSRNMLVNVIAGSYLDRARAQWIRVEHELSVPPELNIADEDLSVLLSNMLQNALEACERMRREADRYIRIEMRLRGNFLFIKCVNSAPEEPAGARRPGHGYGLAAMRRITEKYDSVLLVERAPGEFTVKSDLCLKRG